MKAILEFDLNEPDDRMAHLRCVKSTDMALVIWEFFYNDRKFIEENNLTIEEVFKTFTDTLNEYNINIDELIN